jgi:formylglycine-generating enzyme required for sulfatase activity
VQAGERHCRAQRGLVTRPTVREVYAYRAHVTRRCARCSPRSAGTPSTRRRGWWSSGLHHEQQHQELLLTDIKHVFWTNPMRPAYLPRPPRRRPPARRRFAGTSTTPGSSASGTRAAASRTTTRRRRTGFFLEPFRLASRLATNGEFLAFVEDGGYRRPELWLSAGWAAVQERRWEAPLYREPEETGGASSRSPARARSTRRRRSVT